MAEVSHDQLLERIESTEKEMAVMDTKLNRVQKDLTAISIDIRENRDLAREISVQLKVACRIVISLISVLGLVFVILNYVRAVS